MRARVLLVAVALGLTALLPAAANAAAPPPAPSRSRAVVHVDRRPVRHVEPLRHVLRGRSGL